MKIFVTGHKGTIGGDLMPLFEQHDFTGYDIEEDEHRTHDVTSGDVLSNVMPENVDIVFHLANIPHPVYGMPGERYMNTNVGGCMTVIDVAKRKGAKSFVFISSLAALGFDAPPGKTFTRADEWPKGAPPWDEKTGVLLSEDAWELEPYGTSKVVQESIIKKSGIPYMIFRCGPYGGWDQRRGNEIFDDALSRDHLTPAIKKVLAEGIRKSNVFHVCRPGGLWGGTKLQKWLK